MNFSAYLLKRPMHPVLRLLLAVAGVAVLAFLLVFGAMALLALFAVGCVAMLLQRWRQPGAANQVQGNQEPAATRNPRVLDGDFVVVDHTTPPGP